MEKGQSRALSLQKQITNENDKATSGDHTGSPLRHNENDAGNRRAIRESPLRFTFHSPTKKEDGKIRPPFGFYENLLLPINT